MTGPREVLCDVDTQVFKIVHPLHLGPIYTDGLDGPLLLPAKVCFASGEF